MTDVQLPAGQFLDILNSHASTLRAKGRTPVALRIGSVEAGRCGIAEDITTVLGIPVQRVDNVPAEHMMGRAVLKLDDDSSYMFQIPVYFTES